MAFLGKLLGGVLGWTLGGPIGALLGVALASFFDTSKATTTYDPNQQRGYRPKSAERGDFMVSLVVLATAIMKADGTMTRNELDYVKEFLTRNFGLEATQEALGIIKRLQQQHIPIDDICHQIRFNMDGTQVQQLMYFLFGIAKADGNVCEKEVRLIEQIAMRLGLSQATFNSLKAMYYNDQDTAYQILGVDRNIDDAGLKKAYRRIAIENHPDKVAHLGEDIRKSAEEKFSRINVAYEQIKKQRGIA